MIAARRVGANCNSNMDDQELVPTQKIAAYASRIGQYMGPEMVLFAATF
jgi:hypothetical protein